MINEARGSTFTLTLATPLVRDDTGITDYEQLTNKPTINGVEVSGQLTLQDIGAQPAGEYADEEFSDEEVSQIVNEAVESFAGA